MLLYCAEKVVNLSVVVSWGLLPSGLPRIGARVGGNFRQDLWGLAALVWCKIESSAFPGWVRYGWATNSSARNRSDHGWLLSFDWYRFSFIDRLQDLMVSANVVQSTTRRSMTYHWGWFDR